MQVSLTKQDLIDFEQDIANEFMAKKIKAPIHLEGGSEGFLINFFEEFVEPEDWVLLSWRSHLKCLLKGVPRNEVKAAIMAGKSISLCFPEYRIISSAIVGGMAPIAVGLGMAIKRKGEKRKVCCWVGEMAFECGIVQEAVKYSHQHKLPVQWIVEDNNRSVMTDTTEVWQGRTYRFPSNVIGYHYTPTWPHVGCGKHVQF